MDWLQLAAKMWVIAQLIGVAIIVVGVVFIATHSIRSWRNEKRWRK